MREAYPALADAGTFYRDAIEDVVHDIPDDRFGAVYSVETLQHLHPDAEWVFGELARLAADLLVTVENEGDVQAGATAPEMSYVNDEVPLYFRDWNAVFTDLGFVEADAEPNGRDTVRVFRATPESAGHP